MKFKSWYCVKSYSHASQFPRVYDNFGTIKLAWECANRLKKNGDHLVEIMKLHKKDWFNIDFEIVETL